MSEIFPVAVTLPFVDGARDVPEHIADLFKAHRILTFNLTYDQAIERLNWANADRHMRGAFDAIRQNHLRDLGL